MYQWWLHGSGSEGQWLWGPYGLLLNIASEGEGLEKVWIDPVGQQLAGQLVPTGIQLLQLWDPF